MAIAIRTAAWDDIESILAIEQHSPSAAHWNLEQYAKLSDGGILLVAEEAGRIRGFICAQAVAGEWEIENVVVATESLRRGIADELMRELIQRARTDAASAILLEVRESNLPARLLYRKHGFLELGRRPAYYRGPVEDAILYSLSLRLRR